MTQGERPRRSDRHRPAAPHGASTDIPPVRPRENRVVIAVLVILSIVLCVLIWTLLRGDETPPGPSIGDSPQPLLVVSGPGKGDVPDFRRPLSAAWGSDGDIYVSDTGNRRICVFTDTGRFVREFGGPKSSKSDGSEVVLKQPAGIAVGPDGNVYVADVRAGAVVVFNDRGTFVRRIRPRVPGRVGPPWAPTDVAVSEDLIYVTDAVGVAVFSADGALRNRIDKAGGKPFSYPNGVAVAANGTIVVSDTNNARVVALEESGSVAWSVGPSSEAKRVIGLPRGLSVAQDGSTLVADAFLFGITNISDRGAILQRYGQRGNRPGAFEFPNDVDVREDRVVVTDKQNNRVQVIGWPGLTSTAQ